MTKPKLEERIRARTPKKITAGIFDNLRTLPHPVEETLPPPRTSHMPDADSLLLPVPGAESAPGAVSTSDAKRDAEPVRKVSDAKPAPGAESAPVKGFLRVPNEVIYRTLPSLKPSEAVAYLRLYALSHGFQKDTCTVSLDTLANGCNLSRTQIRVSVRSLERKGWIEQVGTDNTNSNKGLRGLTFKVLSPSPTRAESAPDMNSASHAISAPNKRNTLKDTHNTETGVRVSSRFTLGECRRYVDGQPREGIKNPQGLAVSLHRSGEADELIAKFLEPVESAKAVIDTSGCPDCHGTGFYEPGGAGKGVARCKHERLLETR